MKEIWKDIVGYEGRYQISNYGNVMSLNYNQKGIKKKMKPMVDNVGYAKVNLRKDGKQHIKYVHRLVAEAFIPNPNNFPVVNHIDEIKTNNRYDNLEWCTIKYNVTYGSAIEKRIEKIAKKIAQYEYDGTLVKIWRSAREVNDWYNTNPNSIHDVCKGKREDYYGYIWKYI